MFPIQSGDNAHSRRGGSPPTPSERHITIYDPEHLQRYASVAPYIPTYIAAVKTDLDVTLENVMTNQKQQQQHQQLQKHADPSSDGSSSSQVFSPPHLWSLKVNETLRSTTANREKMRLHNGDHLAKEEKDVLDTPISCTNGSIDPLTETSASWVDDDDSFIRYVVSNQSHKNQCAVSLQSTQESSGEWVSSFHGHQGRSTGNEGRSDAARSAAGGNRRRRGRGSQWQTVGRGR